MWNEFTKDIELRKLICYGAGNNAYSMLRNSSFSPYSEKILFFVDRDEKKNGSKIAVNQFEFDIEPYSSMKNYRNVIVLITITDYKPVGKELDYLGIRWYAWIELLMEITFMPLTDYENINTAYLLNTPDYLNLGDHAIAIAEVDFLKKHYDRVFELGTNMCTVNGLRKLKEYISTNDTIYIQGGGNMGSLWRTCEENIRRIITMFPNNEIIIFPQSIYYGDSNEEREYFAESLGIYNGHKKLKICLRDKKSFEFVKKNYCCQAILTPDMVLTIQDDRNDVQRNGIGVLLRDDKERNIQEDYIEIVRNIVEECGKEMEIISHHSESYLLNRKQRLENMLSKYKSKELIITDRLHGMVFAFITNTPCIVFDNSYKKISALYDTWLKGEEGIIITEPIEKNELSRLMNICFKIKTKETKHELFRNLLDEILFCEQ